MATVFTNAMSPLVTHTVNSAACFNEEVDHDGFDENDDGGGGDGDDNLDGEDTLLVCVDAKGNARWCFTFLLSGSTLDSISAS